MENYLCLTSFGQQVIKIKSKITNLVLNKRNTFEQQDYSEGLAPGGLGGCTIRIRIWQYIPMYPAIIPIYALLSDTLEVLRSDLSGAPPCPLMRNSSSKSTHIHHNHTAQARDNVLSIAVRRHRPWCLLSCLAYQRQRKLYIKVNSTM